MKIDKLTPAQEKLLPKFRQEWHDIGTCTDRADRAKAQAAIIAMRKEIGIMQAPIFIWCDSPATSLVALQFIKSAHWKKFLLRAAAIMRENGLPEVDVLAHREVLGASLRDSLGDSLWASLRASLWASLRDSLGDSLWDSLWASLRASLGASLGDSLWASLRASLGASLRASLGASLGDSLGDSLGASLGDSLRDKTLTEELGKEWWGQHEAYWIAFYLFGRDILGVKYDEKRSRQLDMWRDVAQSCCWWWCYQNYVIVSERPTVVAMDERGRIHSHTGPAVAFADGFKVHASHGVRLPAYVIEDPAKITVALIDKETNAEIRRVMVEQYGAARYITDSGATKLQEDDYGTLYRKEMPGDEAMVFVDVINSTAEPDGSFRKYMLRVPPTVKTAREAVAWTFGKTAETYEPAVQT